MTGHLTWMSHRFGRTVHLTHHAQKRMTDRCLDQALVETLIESGQIRQRDHEHWWIFASFVDRTDNLICAAVLCCEALIIKTLMTHWEEHGS